MDPTYEAEVTGIVPLNGTTELEGGNRTLINDSDLEEYGEPHKILTFWRNMVDLTKRSYTIIAVVLVVLVTVAVLMMSVATVICTKRLCR